MKSHQELLEAMSLVELEIEGGHYYRSIRFKHLAGPIRDPLYAHGPVLSGGRFTLRDTGPDGIYLATDPDTALHEVNAAFNGLSIPSNPHVILTLNVKTTGVLDLTQPANQELFGTNTQELCGPWRSLLIDEQVVPTQILGQVAYESKRVRAILYPSAKQGAPGKCLLVLTKRLGQPPNDGSHIQVLDDDGLLNARLPAKNK